MRKMLHALEPMMQLSMLRNARLYVDTLPASALTVYFAAVEACCRIDLHDPEQQMRL